MPLIIENGTGVVGANSYDSISYITTYLTERNRQTQNSWSTLATNIQEAASIAATDHLEVRFRRCFKGQIEFLNLTLAKNLLILTTQPADTNTVTIGTRTYTFNTVVGGVDSVLIGSTVSISIDNLLLAIRADPSTVGVNYGIGTVVNAQISARAYELDTLIAEALEQGTSGNLIVTTTTIAGATWTNATLSGGTDVGRPQPLSFPRLSLRDANGVVVVGIPERIKQAVAEYAVRAILGTPLSPDPDFTPGAQIIEKEEVVGPLKERTKFLEGGSLLTIVPYPAADNLISEFLSISGSLCRA